MAQGGLIGLLIRTAKPEDLPGIVEMGLRFRKSTKYSNHLIENKDCMVKVAQQLIEKETLLICERDQELIGMIGFILYNHFLSGELVSGEIFWWMEPTSRGQGLRLLREMEKRSKQAGALRNQMVAPDEQTARIYERLGYEFVEATYQKTL